MPYFHCLLILLFAKLLAPTVVASPLLLSDCSEASLRTAIAQTNFIRIGCTGVIHLSEEIEITGREVVLEAPGGVTLLAVNSNRFFRIRASASLTLKGFTLENGRAFGESSSDGQIENAATGGAIAVEDGRLVLDKCTFLNNAAIGVSSISSNNFNPPDTMFARAGLGGAVYAIASDVVITNCVFRANYAKAGYMRLIDVPLTDLHVGAGMGGAIAVVDCTLNASESVFDQNVSDGNTVGNARGGAFWAADSIVRFEKCGFKRNASIANEVSPFEQVVPTYFLGFQDFWWVSSGGAVFLDNSDGGVVFCEFEQNSALSLLPSELVGQPTLGRHAMGGAITSTKLLGVVGCSFEGNSTQNYGPSAGAGGGIASSGSLSVQRSFFNDSVLKKGGEFSGPGYGGAIFSVGTTEIDSTTFFGNTVSGGNSYEPPPDDVHFRGARGGGIFHAGGRLSLAYVTFAFNKTESLTPATNAGGGSVYIERGEARSKAGIFGLGTATETLYFEDCPGPACKFTRVERQQNCKGTLIDDGYNISSDESCNFTRSLNNTDPQLEVGPFRGRPPAIGLRYSSPARDLGPREDVHLLDQHGKARSGNGRPDAGAIEMLTPEFRIFWQHSTGQLGLWEGNLYSFEASLLWPLGEPLTVHNSWSIAGSADFTGDYKKDWLWRNTNGQFALWKDSTSVSSLPPAWLSDSEKTLLPFPATGPNWHVVGFRDFDSNGSLDIFWHHITGQLGIWYLERTNLLRAEIVQNLPLADHDWRPVQLIDGPEPGQLRLVWQHRLSGHIGAWDLAYTGGPAPTFSLTNLIVETNWHGWGVWDLIALEDFDGDAQKDFLWQNKHTGELGLWIFWNWEKRKGPQYFPFWKPPTAPGPDWRVFHLEAAPPN